MLVKTLRFVSLLCAALTLGLTLTHDLEIPGKQMLRGADWLIVQQTFYGGFAIVGGVAEVLGLISTGVLLVLLRERRTSFILTVVAALSFVSMLALFAFGNNPLNPEARGAGVGQARLSGPNGPLAHPQQGGQLALGQARAGPAPGRRRHSREPPRTGWMA